MLHRQLTLWLMMLLAVVATRADNFFDIEGGEATSVGVYIKDLATGKVIADHNSGLALTPASITKALTTATALNLLGDDYAFTTKVELSGQRAGSKWDGNLVIHASGDPTLGSKQFKKSAAFSDSIIANLRRMGVSSISGTVVVREAMLDQGPVPQWEIEDVAWPYGAGLFAFNWAGNTVMLSPTSGSSVPASNLKVTLKPSPEKKGLDLLRGVNSQHVTVWGTSKMRSNKNWRVEVTIPDPAEVYANLLIAKLKAAGIEISRQVAKADNSKGTTVYNHKSPSLAAIGRDLMKRSDNLFAEGVLRAIKPGDSREECIKLEKKFWEDKGFSPRAVQLSDGSGLTRSNRFSPRYLGCVLEWMAASEHADAYLDCFPVAGIDGTLKSFMAKTSLKGRLALKTGSMSAVQAYAGYKLNGEGKPTHVVVIMVNGFVCSRASLRAAISKFLLSTFPLEGTAK